MSEMIKNGLVPNLEHSVAIDYGFERVRAECAERHGEKAKCRGNANKYNHFLCYLQRPFNPAKVIIQFCPLRPEIGSGRKLPHSKSWRMFDAASQFAKGFGVRRPSGALETDPGDATYGEERKSARRFRAAYV